MKTKRMTKKQKAIIQVAYEQGRDAVRNQPLYAPSNPYNCREQPIEYQAWDDGAYDEGLYDIYTNGILGQVHYKDLRKIAK
jgi:hypothetical protein